MAICYEVERSVTTRSPERERVGAVLRARRKELGISQEAMARRVKLSYPGYRPWEAGQRDLKSEDLPVWADALELTQAELASRLGLGAVRIESVYAAEVEGLLARVRDPEAVEEVMAAIRTMARLAARSSPPEGDT